MAIGLARLFGIRFPMNFNSPYKAVSIAEFWQRWHITLTRFLREYVYFPLGGNRCAPARHVFNIMATMFLSGLWHGAGWTYVIWGGLHGFYLVVAHRWRLFVERCGWELNYWWYRFLSVTLTFVVVLFAWVFFRAPTLSVAGSVLSSMAGLHGLTMSDDLIVPATGPARWLRHLLRHLGVHFVPKPFAEVDYTGSIGLILAMLAVVLILPNTQQMLADHVPVLERSQRPRSWYLTLGWRDGLFLGGLFFPVVHGFYSAPPSPFIYFHF
jgi:alginate O-acetyltransferase complex protein AlgI